MVINIYKKHASFASLVIQSSRHVCYSTLLVLCFLMALQTLPARSVETICVTLPARSMRRLKNPCICTAARPWPGSLLMKTATRHQPRSLPAVTNWETLSLGLAVHRPRFLDPGASGKKFSDALEDYDHMAGMWIVGEDMPQRKESRSHYMQTEKDQHGQPVSLMCTLMITRTIFAMRNHAYKQGTTGLRSSRRKNGLGNTALPFNP